MAIKILHCMYALHGGGAERQLTILANHQDSESMEFGIFCVNDAISDVDTNICEVLLLEDKNSYPYRMIGEVLRAIDKFNPDIVHVWLPPSISAPALIAAKIRRKPAVASYRNKKIFESWIRIPEFLTTLLFADGIVSNNPPEQSSYLFRKLFYYKKNTVIPNAVSIPDEYRNIESKGFGDKLEILFVGRLTQQKNWQVLLQALGELKQNNSWNLRICGKGEDEHKIVAMAKELNLLDRVEMLGYREDVYSIMNESDLLVLPSWYEGMPNVVLEAMAMGLPCVVSDIPAHKLLFGDQSGVLYFDPHSSQELGKTLAGIVDQKIDLEERARQGLKFSQQFTPEQMLVKYAEFYSGILKSDKNKPGMMVS